MEFWHSTIHVPANQLVALARHADELGFAGTMGPDHLVWAGTVASKYPYNESGQVWWPETAEWPDPWVSVGAMAAATTRLRLGHHVYILPLRDPVSVAKAIATAAAIAGGRVVLAFGLGWMREEFELVGQQFEARGRRTEEMLEIMQALWTGERVSHQGEFYRFEDISIRPIPPEAVPIIGAGHGDRALRRAGELCDGWLGATRFSAQELVAIVEKLNQHRQDARRLDRPFEILISVSKRDHNPDTIAAVEAMGVTGLIVAPWSIFPNLDTDSVEGKLRAMDEFAKAFL
jgi:probable F420-dependent oxidoreductase